MKLRDLAEQSVTTSPAKAKADQHTASPSTEKWPDVPAGVKWIVLESKVLNGEEILLVMWKKYLKEARKEHPGKVIYFPPEVEEIARHQDIPGFDDYLRKIHLIKKEFGAWIVPSDSPAHRAPTGVQEPSTTPIHIWREKEKRHVGHVSTPGAEQKPARADQMELDLGRMSR